jgi:uncharacterized protein
VTVEPGERRDLAPTASESYTGDRTTLPMAVINGAEDGPRVFVTAAVHGDELNGIAIARHLLDLLDAGDAAGRWWWCPSSTCWACRSGPATCRTVAT